MKKVPDETIVLSAFRQELERIAPLDDHAWSVLADTLRVDSVRRGALLLEEGAVCRHIWFVYSGSFRALYAGEEKDATTALFTDGSWMTNMKSLVSGAPSDQVIEVLGNAVVIRISKEVLIGLYAVAPALESLGRRLLEHMLAEESEWKEMYTRYDVEERYRFLLRKAPQFLRQVPLQYIASFLGIRRETLSRIRGKVARGSS